MGDEDSLSPRTPGGLESAPPKIRHPGNMTKTGLQEAMDWDPLFCAVALGARGLVQSCSINNQVNE